MPDTEESRRLLLQSSYVFRQLSTEHDSLDDRLKRIARKTHLTDDEQLDAVRMKKEKLRLKDQMEAFLRDHRPPAAARPH